MSKIIDLVGYEGLYCVDEDGNIHTMPRKGSKGGIMKTYTDPVGYKRVRLCKDGHTSIHYVHRVIASCFIPNPNNYPCINHKDGNKLNNSLDNLEWCTYSHNLVHAFENNLNRANQPKAINIGIDVGVNTGICVVNKEGIVHTETISPFKIVTKIKDIQDNHGRIDTIYVEDPSQNKPVFNRNVNKLQMLKIAQNVGANKRDADWVVHLLESNGFKISLIRPTSAKWTKHQFEMITKYEKRVSQHVRDAAKLVFGR